MRPIRLAVVAILTIAGSVSAQSNSADPRFEVATIKPNRSGIGFSGVWGLGFWKGKLFGFTQGGQFLTIDPMTGAGTLVQGNGPEWWGAAVTTVAPIIP